MPTQPAILGTMRLGNFRLGYRPAALAAVRLTKARITLAGLPVRVREGSVSIRDGANDTPNTCSLTVDTATPPVSAQRLRITINSDAPRLLFDGALETVTEAVEGFPQRVMYPCTAQDDTPRANRRIPLGYWENVSATIVAQELVADYVPGFTSVHVQAGLPTVTLLLDGSEGGMNGCLRALVKQMGGGYFYWEARDLYLFQDVTDDLPDDLDSTPGRILDDPPISVTRDDAQLRTRVYGKGHQEATLSDVAIGGTTIPLGDVSMYTPAGGQVISQSQILAYTGTVVGGAGALVGTTVTPTNPPSVAPKTATGLTPGDYSWVVTFVTAAGETRPGPASPVLTLGGSVTAPSTAPTATKKLGGALSPGAYKWKTAFVDSAGGITTVSPESASVTMDDVAAPTTNGTVSSAGGAPHNLSGALTPSRTYSYVNTFGEGAFETLPSPAAVGAAGTQGAIKLSRAELQAEPAGLQRRFYRTVLAGGAGTHHRMPGPSQSRGFSSDDSNYYFDLQSDAAVGAGAAAPSSNTALYRSATVTVPVSTDPNVVTVNVYRTEANGSTWKLAGSVANGTTSWVDTVADGSLGATAPTVNTTSYLAATVTNISIGPAGTTQRKGYRPVAGGSTYKLAWTLANNTGTSVTDTTPDASLGADAPTVDTSGLVAQSGEVPAGSTSLLVTATPFAPTGGWVFIGTLGIRYAGISGSSLTGIPASGPGSLPTTVRYGSEIIAASMLTGVTGLVRALIKGAPIHLWVERNDLAAQAALIAREGEGDGIIEHLITDDRRGEASLIALCDADLAQFAYPIVTVTGATRDVKMKSGKPLVIDRATPFIDETLTIQDLTIDEIDIAPGTAPRFTFTASSVRFSVDDLLRRMASGLGGM